MASKKKPPKKRGRPEERLVIDDPADALQRLFRAPPKKRQRPSKAR